MLDAREAKRLTDFRLLGTPEIIKRYVDFVERNIKNEISQGKGSNHITDPFAGVYSAGIGHPCQRDEDAVREAVEARGYTWTNHPSKDGRHNRPYTTTVSWSNPKPTMDWENDGSEYGHYIEPPKAKAKKKIVEREQQIQSKELQVDNLKSEIAEQTQALKQAEKETEQLRQFLGTPLDTR